MRVLYCTDGSESSSGVISALKDIVKGAVVDIICVIDWSFLPENIGINDEISVNAYDSVAQRILDTAVSKLENNELVVGDKIKEMGSPVEKIISQSKKKNYSLILMGSNGKHGIKKWLGAVSYQVAYETKLPLYVSKRVNTHKKVLFTIDGLDDNLDSIDTALDLLDLRDKEIYLCSVLETNDLLFVERTIEPDWISKVEEQRRIFLENSMTATELLFKKHNLKVNYSEILAGNPAEELIDYARKNEIDLIVMGAKNKNKLTSLFLGSVSRRVLEHTLSDCLIIKEV